MLHLPTIHGLIDRRILVNYRVDPDILARLLPRPFRPKLVGEFGMAGICLIRLRDIRPHYVPAFLGISSENAAHRIAVTWDKCGQTREGVFIPRRDSSSRLNGLAGGRLFPGMYNHAQFTTAEYGDDFSVAMESDDRRTRVVVNGQIAKALPADSVFASLDEASAFFERGSLGYSATRDRGRFDGLELRSRVWRVEPLALDRVESSFFEDRRLFSAQAIRFDCALVMRDIPHEWHAHEQLESAGGYSERADIL